MAHRCWAVEEIVRAIVANLVRDHNRASAVALASCSKSLEEPALAVVWRRLPGLIPLVKCFPPDVWEIQRKDKILAFKRAPTQAEWIRFQKRYAPKVRYLNRSYSEIHLSSTALHILQLYSSDGPLLPNLISLEWLGDEVFLPFISMFISPSLSSIVVKLFNTSPMLPPILKRLSRSLSDIRDIEIEMYADDHNTSMKEASSQLLMCCNHRLRKFRVDSPISAAALRHVIQLPSLEEFQLVINSLKLPDPLPDLVFPSLRKLEVKCNGDLTWLKLLPAIQNPWPVLTSITINCPGSDVERFMEAFQQTMTTCGMHESLQDLWWESPENFKITPRMIAHNLSFKNLTSLVMATECSGFCPTFDLTDDDIDLLTKAMPHLESLRLGDGACGVPSKITFKSLYTISRRCKRLNHLEIHFNPAAFVTKVGTKLESWDVALGLSDPKTSSSDLCKMTVVFTGDIPLPAQSDASSILALGLLGVFPHLEGVEGDWDEVDQLVRICQRMGCSAFGKR